MILELGSRLRLKVALGCSGTTQSHFLTISNKVFFFWAGLSRKIGIMSPESKVLFSKI